MADLECEHFGLPVVGGLERFGGIVEAGVTELGGDREDPLDDGARFTAERFAESSEAGWEWPVECVSDRVPEVMVQDLGGQFGGDRVSECGRGLVGQQRGVVVEPTDQNGSIDVVELAAAELEHGQKDLTSRPYAQNREDVHCLLAGGLAEASRGYGRAVTDRLLDAAEVAERLNVPVWVRESTRSGAMPCIELGRYRRYDWPAVEAWLETWYADQWFEDGKRWQGWKPLTIKVYRNAIDACLEPSFGTEVASGVASWTLATGPLVASTPYRSDDDLVFCDPKRGTALEDEWYRQEFLAALAEAGVEGRIRAFHDMRHTALTNLAATGASRIAVLATAGHRSMQTKKGYLHLAGTVFPDDAANLERRMLGVQSSGTKSPDPAQLGGSS